MTTIHAATMDSPRLKRVLAALTDYAPAELSTREIMRLANVCAVNSCIAELRDNGFDVRCQQRGRYFYYRLVVAGVQGELTI